MINFFPTHLTNLFGQEKKIIGQKIRVFIGQLTFLLDILLEDFLELFPILLDLSEIDNFLKKDQNKDLELAAEDLRMATRHLGSIVGKVDVEEILGSIFKDFCIGK